MNLGKANRQIYSPEGVDSVMGSNEGHTAKPDNQENYEAAVLEFLDKEMATVKPASRNDQSEELDALVSDLLKQVIKESDQPKDTRREATEISEEESLLAEFPPTEVEAFPPSSTVQSTAEASPTPAEIKDESTEKPAETAPEIPAFTKPSESVFPPPADAKRKILMMAIAAAFLVAIIGIGSYHFYFSNSLKSASSVGESQPDAAVPPATEAQNQAGPVSTQTGSNAVTHQPTQPAADKASAVAQSPDQAPAVPVQKPAAYNAEPAPAAVSQTVTPAKIQPEPVQPVPAAKPVIPTANNGEKPATAPIAQTGTPVNPPAPAVVAASPAEEKPTPAPDVAAQEKKLAPPAPVANPSIENSAPVSQPPVQAPVSRTLIPAVAISQVSPTYPEAAIRSRISATIVLDLQIDAQGKVIKATPVSGPVLFHNAAITAVMKWRYRPASIGGNNVASQSKVTLNFNIKQ